MKSQANCASIRTRPRALPRCIRHVSVLLCAALLMGVPVYAENSAEMPPPVPGPAGLFSWSAEIVNKTDGELFKLMKEQGLTVLYQNISSKNSRQEQMSVFAETAMEEGITVYYLTGAPSWGLDPEGAQPPRGRGGGRRLQSPNQTEIPGAAEEGRRNVGDCPAVGGNYV